MIFRRFYLNRIWRLRIVFALGALGLTHCGVKAPPLAPDTPATREAGQLNGRYFDLTAEEYKNYDTPEKVETDETNWEYYTDEEKKIQTERARRRTKPAIKAPPKTPEN